MKRIIFRIIMITILVAGFSAQNVFATDSNAEDQIEFYYDLLENGTVEITGFEGTGEGVLVIPQTIDGYRVSRIGESAFSWCDRFTGNLMIPEGITDIGDCAFYNCSGFSGVLNLPEGLISVGSKAFYQCDFGGDLIIPDSVESIGKEAFYQCGFTGGLKLSANLKSIGDSAFYNCKFTGGLTLPEGLEEVGADAFYQCRFTGDLNLPSSLTSVGDGGFSFAFENRNYIFDSHLNVDKISSGFSPTAFFDRVYIVGKGSLRVGEQHQNLVCTQGRLLLPSSMVKKWSSDDPNVASVDSEGVVTANSVGKTRINVETYNGLTTSVDIAVKKRVEGIRRGGITWYIPERIKLGYEFRDPDDWSNRDISQGVSVATVKGLFEYIDGKHYCLARTDEGHKLFNYLIAGALGYEGLIMMDEAHPTFHGFYAVSPGTMKFHLEVRNMATNESIAIGEPYEVTIEEPVISTNAPEKVYVGDTITLKSELQNTDLQNEEIGPYKDQLKTKKDDLFYYISDHMVYEPEFILESGRDLIDCSEGDFSQMLTASEKLTFKKAGTVKIRVRYQHLKLNTEMWDFYSPEKTITIQVRDRNTSVTALKLNKTALRLKKGKTAQLSAEISPSDASDKSVEWVSSNPKVAKVSNGKVTAKEFGTATITAKAKGESGKTAKCRVVVGYGITYKLNGGKNNPANPAAYYKERITFKNPTRKGYMFKGWYSDKRFKKKITKLAASTTGNKTLYAKWEKVSVGKTKITGLKNSAKGKAKLTFKAVRKAKGYEVVYGTDKKLKKGSKAVFTKGKSLTLKKLQKEKTYYVKARAYQVDSAGNRVYGKFSSTERVKISK